MLTARLPSVSLAFPVPIVHGLQVASRIGACLPPPSVSHTFAQLNGRSFGAKPANDLPWPSSLVRLVAAAGRAGTRSPLPPKAQACGTLVLDPISAGGHWLVV